MKKVLLSIMIIIMAIIISFSMVACKNNDLASDTVTYDGEYIRWEEVSGIKKYLLSINGGDGIEVSGTEYHFSAAETFTVKISTVPEREVFGKKLGKELEVEKTFTYLNRPSEVSFQDGMLNWTVVEGAETYKIQINSNVVNGNHLGNSYTLPADITGQAAIRIMAQKGGNSFFSKWSDTLNLYILPAPQNIAYNGETQTISWGSVAQASSYKVILNNGQPIDVQSTSYQYNANKNNFDIKVQAVGNNNNIISSKESEKVEYLYLAPIVNFSVIDGILSWGQIENATSYKLKVKHQGAEQIHEQEVTSFYNLDPGKAYQIEVFPMTAGKNYFSSWSTTETINILSIPANIRYESNNHITWESVSNATSYKIKFYKNNSLIKEEVLSVDGNTGINVGERFNEAAEYEVKIQADTNQKTYYGSKLSDAITIIRLDKPAAYTVTDNPRVDDSTNVTFTAVKDASGYQIRYDATNYRNITTTSFKPQFNEQAKDEPQEINVSISSKGDITNHSSKKYVLDSINTLSFKLKRLATPQGLRVDNGTIRWDDVLDNSGYVVYIDGSNISELTGRELIVPTIAAGNHTIAVKAKGNGSNIVSSVLSNSYAVTKLTTPVNLQVSESKVTWSQTNGCTGYKLSIKQENLNSNITEYQLIAGDISTNGTIINVVALGNGAELIDSDVSLSKTVRKLTAPTNISVSPQGDNVVWNAPSNAHGSTISYDLEVGRVLLQNGMGLSSASWSAGNLAVGGNTIRVKAKGDKSETFDSDYSDEKTVTKLAAMDVRVSGDNTKYQWSDINGADSYTYRIGGGSVQTLLNSVTSWSPNFTVAKTEETVYFQAKGDYLNGICHSEITTKTLSIVALQKIANERIEYLCDTENGKITVKISEEYITANALQKFIYSTSGTESTQGREFTYNFTGTPRIDFSVKAAGGYFGEKSGGSDTYYVTSTPSDQKTIEVLGAPTISAAKQQSGDFIITFAVQSIVGEIEYELTYHTASGDQTEPAKTIITRTFVLEKGQSATGFSIRARAIGDGESTFDSKWSALFTSKNVW